ncbi:hypothetical protein QMZ22_06110 [Enterococcus faecalis]|uniref:hypothetical protein n=1 Tax=Enterococcus faecalis TaxID=1351 RepID=UPI003D9FEC8C
MRQSGVEITDVFFDSAHLHTTTKSDLFIGCFCSPTLGQKREKCLRHFSFLVPTGLSLWAQKEIPFAEKKDGSTVLKKQKRKDVIPQFHKHIRKRKSGKSTF